MKTKVKRIMTIGINLKICLYMFLKTLISRDMSQRKTLNFDKY